MWHRLQRVDVDGSVTQLRSLWDVPDGMEPNRAERWKLAVNAWFKSHLQTGGRWPLGSSSAQSIQKP
ncbi:hypothetical protein FOXB_07216 [Fusarium oxysporum f. sp. conglutinans Fo5176]|uniref:Uncharacterized protein n=1 Tax=Fusarium oxysporum (strain Fo5176) TaxID=660025 RepID=F9FLD6_FUSOF|nr:hypothetical protein FOXB_07216 [Fusarium oxysporum f. sp. conglutinans Fo5176]